jgi:4-amino-4-deoxy-L-arabinose transferase-like glycosyltransferase
VGRVLSESLATLLLLAAAIAGYRLFTGARPAAAWAAALGVAVAAATMVRPVTYYLPLLVLVLLAARVLRHRVAWRPTVAVAAAFLLPVAVVLGGWQLRNHRAVGSWRLSGVEGKNMLQFRAAGVLADARGIPILDAKAQLFATLDRTLHREHFADAGHRAGARYDTMYRQGVHVLRAHPVAAVKTTALGLLAEVGNVRLTMNELSLDRWREPVRVALYACYACALYAIVHIARARRNLLAHAWIVGIAAYVLLASAGPEAFGGRGERFRAPILPIVLVYAAAGAAALVSRIRPRAAAR